MLKRVIFLSCVASAILMASDVKFYGGIGEYKDDGASERMKSLDLSGNFYSYGSGTVANVNANYTKYTSDTRRYDVGIGATLGYQFGSPKDPTGAFRILPIGLEAIGYTFAKEYSYADKTLVYYKGGVEYQNDSLGESRVYTKLDAYYKAALNSLSIAGYDLQPKGYEVGAEVGYIFDSNLLLGFKAGYKDINDKFDGEKVNFHKGPELKMSLGYKF